MLITFVIYRIPSQEHRLLCNYFELHTHTQTHTHSVYKFYECLQFPAKQLQDAHDARGISRIRRSHLKLGWKFDNLEEQFESRFPIHETLRLLASFTPGPARRRPNAHLHPSCMGISACGHSRHSRPTTKVRSAGAMHHCAAVCITIMESITLALFQSHCSDCLLAANKPIIEMLLSPPAILSGSTAERNGRCTDTKASTSRAI
ncbi:hypothetical protein BJY04DRAFT_181695 [Aspergillus karnatakaensis]|uniref:uncharacterized protein n=1 Tax=Aspergillus karnatakaensis TaxID=1810916 RepID=UPI003CCDBADC